MLKMKNQHGSITDQSFYKGFCDKHVTPEWREEHDSDRATAEAKKFYRRTMRGRRWADSQQSALSAPTPHPAEALDGAEDDDDPFSTVGNNRRKNLSLLKKVWRLPGGAPTVPNAVYEAVDKAMAKFAIRKRKEFTAEACKYWSLKREARRGAPLIKRFQAQMESFTSMEVTRRNFAAMGAIGRPRLKRRIDFAEMLEKNMVAARALCDLVTERERLKLLDAQLMQQSVDSVYFPTIPSLRAVLEKAHYLDGNVPHSKHWFKEGLEAVQAKMNHRELITTASFTVEIAKAFSAVIRNADSDVRAQMDDPDASTGQRAHANMQKKEKRNRAKRIISNLTPLFKEATQKECDLSMAHFPEEWKEVETMLKECTEVASNSAPFASNHDLDDTTAGAIEDEDDGDVTMTDANYHSNETNVTIAKKHSRATNESRTLSGAEHVSSSLQRMDRADASSTVPTLSNSGSTNPSAQPDPQTPPLMVDPSLLTPSEQGGLLWCVAPFSPIGTTLHDERWTGREVLRGMSEELSEMDDDAIDDLMAAEPVQPVQPALPVLPAQPVEPNGQKHDSLSVEVSEKPKTRPKRRRIR